MKSIVIVLCLILLTACNQPYSGAPAVKAAAPEAAPASAVQVQVATFMPGDGTISVKVCREAKVYTKEEESDQYYDNYTIPAGTQFMAYALSQKWVTMYPDREVATGRTRPQYIRADTLC
jgi:hypothetical protein